MVPSSLAELTLDAGVTLLAGADALGPMLPVNLWVRYASWTRMYVTPEPMPAPNQARRPTARPRNRMPPTTAPARIPNVVRTGKPYWDQTPIQKKSTTIQSSEHANTVSMSLISSGHHNIVIDRSGATHQQLLVPVLPQLLEIVDLGIVVAGTIDG